MTAAKYRYIESIIEIYWVVNFIRLILFQNVIRFHKCNVTRTPLQVYRGVKKRRIHREWAIKKRWRKSRELTWRKMFARWRHKLREEFNKILMKQMNPIFVMCAMQQQFKQFKKYK